MGTVALVHQVMKTNRRDPVSFKGALASSTSVSLIAFRFKIIKLGQRIFRKRHTIHSNTRRSGLS